MSAPALTPATHAASDRRTLLLFLGCNALLRAAFLGINRGEYTDGILQITQFERTDSFWPPLYTAIVWVLHRGAGLDPIWAGRLVSWGAAVALVVPLWAVARRWGGRRAAFWTLAIYTAAPVALRWSVRLMTDMLFACLLFWAVKVLLDLYGSIVQRKQCGTAAPGCESSPACGTVAPGCESSTGFPERSARSLSVGAAVVRLTVLAVLATLTRYQGLLLAPLVLLVLVQMVRGRWGKAGSASERGWRWAAVLSQAGWLALPLWFLWQRFGHLGQVEERMSAAGLGSTLLHYWDFCEMFLYMTPYALTLPVFGFFAVGLVAPHVRCAGFSRSTGEDARPGNGTSSGDGFPAHPHGTARATDGTTNVCSSGLSRSTGEDGPSGSGTPPSDDLPPEGGTTYIGSAAPLPCPAGTPRPLSPLHPPRPLGPLHPPLLPLFLYVSVAILLAQSVFQSFQERYIFPLLLFAFVVAGRGMALAQERLCGRERDDRNEDSRNGRSVRGGRAVFAVLATVTLVWSLGFGLASIYLQREAFGDLFDAAAHIRGLENLSPDAIVYTNETYKFEQGINGVKMAYLTGRRTELLPEFGPWLLYLQYCKQLPPGRSPEPMDWDRLYQEYCRHLPPEPGHAPAGAGPTGTAGATGAVNRDHCPHMAPGSIVAVHSMNSMGYAADLTLLALLRERYELRSLTNGVPFLARIVPLLPDLMAEPGSHQQPQAWTMRYQEQMFRTDLFLVVGPKR